IKAAGGNISIKTSGNLNVDQAGNTVSGPGNISLTTATGVLTVSQHVTNTSTLGGRVLTLTGAGGGVLNAGAVVSQSQGQALTINITGTGSTGSAGVGVTLNGASVAGTGGKVTLDGTGMGTGNQRIGVLLSGGATVSSTFSGAVTLKGTGSGTGTNSNGG